MASTIPGYNYDIFISYRQKDNKGDRWVSEFVDALKDELESTFKEDISVYFDENPHDRLQDTHNVDKSLEGKLNCLIFIPIISQTYCDPRSYAWQYEFLAFNSLAEKDQYGKDVKLKSGNVTSRILPIRIHDLDAEDVKLYEKESGSVLRALDFVFKTSSGVNRPLTPSDNPDKNLNKTFYRDQINKVANAIKEIILGLKTDPETPVIREIQQKEPSEQVNVEGKRVSQRKPLRKISKRMLLSGIAIIAILIITVIFAYPKLFHGDRLEYLRSKDRISVAVMPFQNLTKDATLNDWQNLIQYNLINSLSNSVELQVRQIESIDNLIQSKGLTDYTFLTPTVASSISNKLDANVFIYGSIGQVGNTIRVYAQLIDSKTGEIFKPFQLEVFSPEEFNYKIIDSLSSMVKDFLIISTLKKEVSTNYQNFVSTNSPKAYRHYTYGERAFFEGDYERAVNHYMDALDIDSNFFYATLMISHAYGNQGLYNQAKNWLLLAYEKRDQLPNLLKAYTNSTYAGYFETPYERIKYFKELLTFDDQSPIFFEQLGFTYRMLYQYDKEIPELEKTLEIYNKWKSKPRWVFIYSHLGHAYHATGQYSKEKKLYKKAEKDFPDHPALIYRQAVLSLYEGKKKTANEYIEKYKSNRRNNSATEVAIVSSLAGIYSEAGIPDKAEEYYREALLLEPENSGSMNAIAYFLIDNDRDIKEGLELVDEALELRPDNFDFLHTKGWGLYKQGQYQEAKDILQKSWDLRRENAIYNHEAFLHLEEAEKAVASQKSN